MRPPSVDRLMYSLREQLVKAREQGYRRGLRHAGYLPHSIDLAVDKDREWIERGK